ncbi:ABC transporter ATP-binding protein [Clostridium ihumii]|uniref:ABC transporter ATP-binding protein n=1 Tax=Clostridium ihumii TaxID=1470356 RepID=UPI003D336CB2
MINNNKRISIFKMLKTVVPIAFLTCPLYFIFSSILGVFHGVSFGVNTFMTQKFFDMVANTIKMKGEFKNVVYMTILLGIVLIINQILNGLSNFASMNLVKKITGSMNKIVNEKSGKIRAIYFENPKFLDDINKAKEGVTASVEIVIVIVLLLTFYVPYFIFMGIYLYKLKPVLAFSIILIFIPVALTQFVRVKVFGDLEDEAAPLRRENNYYESCMVEKEYYKETRILGIFGYFKDLHLKSLRLLNKKIWKAERKVDFIEIGMSIVTLLGYASVLYLLFRALMQREISIGAFGAVFASVDIMFSIMKEIICSHIGELTKGLGAVRNFIRFLEIPEETGEAINIDTFDIVMNDVSFIYPYAKNKSLNSVNLKIKENETIAIVGENGAGKTTLVKLIMGIYMPTEGTVKIGNVDTKKASMKSLYKDISCVFQKYQRYKMTLKENVVIGYVDGDDKYIENNFEDSICKSDLDVNKKSFPNGYETMLSREVDGVDLSGGQWQRVAIARGFYKNHKMIVLDEPTAAIDPIEETKIYKKFSEMAKGNTAIIVTHRLGSAKIADRIVVMDDGKISEIGSHEELMESSGKYREMYDAQREWYVR